MKKQTFVMEIYETQHQSWQGKLRWVQGQEEQCFRSVLELLCLINSVIDKEKLRDRPDCRLRIYDRSQMKK